MKEKRKYIYITQNIERSIIFRFYLFVNQQTNLFLNCLYCFFPVCQQT